MTLLVTLVLDDPADEQNLDRIEADRLGALCDEFVDAGVEVARGRIDDGTAAAPEPQYLELPKRVSGVAPEFCLDAPLQPPDLLESANAAPRPFRGRATEEPRRSIVVPAYDNATRELRKLFLELLPAVAKVVDEDRVSERLELGVQAFDWLDPDVGIAGAVKSLCE